MPETFVLHDHGYWTEFLPFTFTRPVAEIRTGIFTITEKWEIALDQDPTYKTEPYLQTKFPAPEQGEVLVINATIAPNEPLVKAIQKLKPNTVLKQDDEPIACYMPAEDIPDKGLQDLPDSYAVKNYNKSLLQIKHKWDIFGYNPLQIQQDFQVITEGRVSAFVNETNTILGTNPVFVEEGVSLECCTLNTQKGPIYIGHEANIMEGSHLRGPLAVCEHGTVKIGAKIYEGTTIGPFCKAGGEVNNTVMFGYSNKAHDGFLGNSVIGEWCNIGADTNNSNLKNDYKDVKVWDYHKEGFAQTGQQFCGLFMADHAKCAINTMFNTGTTVGVSANIYGGGFPRIFIPSFSWGGASGFTTYKLEKAMETANQMMGRRDLSLTDADQEIFKTIFEKTEHYRR